MTKKTEILPLPNSNPCYCCGVDTENNKLVGWFGGALKVWLCPLCLGTEYVWTEDGYWILRCPFHGDEDVKGEIAYWDALDKFNEKAKEIGSKSKRHIRSYNRQTSWQAEIAKLREAYKCLLKDT